MLKVGAGQGCQAQKCLNTHPHNNQLVGAGVYSSPNFLTCLNGYTALNPNDPNDKFHLVLQCRARPKSIKMPFQSCEAWVINESKDIRPYGIILFTKEQKIQLQKIATNVLYK